MPPNGYRITDPVLGFAEGDVLNVTRRYRHRHPNRMELEHIGATPGAATVVVADELTGFSESDVLDPTARISDWHVYGRTFPAGDGTVVTTGEEPIQLTPAALSRIADPISG